VGTAAAMLKRKRVQDAVRERMEPVRLEQERQRLVADAVEDATAKLEAERSALKSELTGVLSLPNIRVMGNEEIVERALMRLVLLDPERHGRLILEASKTALAVAGLMQMGMTRRVAPVHGGGETKEDGTYTSLFDRIRAERALEPALPSPVIEGVFDLATRKRVADVVEPDMRPPEPAAPVVLPPMGESIETVTAKTPVADQRVITVEVG
jgi:hypothetical protein